MFGLFGKKNKDLKVYDKIWLTEKSKFNACLAIKIANKEVVFIAWFEETRRNLQTYFVENQIEAEIHLADRFSSAMNDKVLIFVEHHPLISEEERKATELGINEVTIFSSLSEPIFQLLGGEKLIDLMQKMGIKENEVIEHNMISSSIKNAQKKIASKSIMNASGRSQNEWLLNAGITKQTI